MKSRRTRFVLSLLGTLGLLSLVGPAAALADFGPQGVIGSEGEGAGQMLRPQGVATAANGDVYVVDADDNRVAVFDAAGVFRFAFGKNVNAGAGDPDLCTTDCQPGTGFSEAAGAFYAPSGIAIDASGRVLVANSHNNRIDFFSAAGAFLFAVGTAVNPGAGDPNVCTTATGCQAGTDTQPNSIAGPSGIEVDQASGTIYVPSGGASRVDLLSETGTFVGAFGFHVNVNPGAADPNLCSGMECQNGSVGQGAGVFSSPTDVALLPGDRLAVADRGNRRVDILTRAGTFLEAFGREVNVGAGNPDVCTTECKVGNNSGAGGLLSTSALAAAPGGSFYVADPEENRVSQFAGDGSFIRAFGQGVLDGAPEFQVCTTATGCLTGQQGKAPGAITSPLALATVGSDVLVGEAGGGNGASRVEVIGEPKPPVTPENPENPETPGDPANPAGPASGGGNPSGTGGIAAPPLPLARPSNQLLFGALKLNLERGTAVLGVRVGAPGRLVLHGKGIRRKQVTATGPGTVKLTVALKGAARRTLLEKAVVRVTAKVTFTPAGGEARTVRRKLTLRAALGR